MTALEERRYKAHLGTCIPGLMPSVRDQETRKSDNFPLDALTQHAETLLKKKRLVPILEKSRQVYGHRGATLACV